MNNDRPTKGVLSWLTIVLGIITIGTLIAVSGPGVRYYGDVMMGNSYGKGGGVAYPTSEGSVPSSVTSAPSVGMMRPDIYPYPYPNPEVPVTDTREFLKMYYNAMMRTRDVPSLTRRVETTVRGYSGRIDQESSSPEYGSVSFALPQAKYEAFRTELETLVGSRFLTINISSQNLLAQKVSIEEQQKQADKNLADYKAARQKLVIAHANVVQSLQAKIDVAAATSSDRILYQQQLANENASYATQLKNADANIKYAQDWQKAVQTQDKVLLDNVATVTGTVSIQRISLWEIVLLYLPGYWIPFIFAVLTVLSYLNDRRRLVSLVP